LSPAGWEESRAVIQPARGQSGAYLELSELNHAVGGQRRHDLGSE
jgi:hypothetical protein